MVSPLILPPNGELECQQYSENSPGSAGLDISAESAFSRPAFSTPGPFEVDPCDARSSGPPNNTPESTILSLSSYRNAEFQMQEHSQSNSVNRLSVLTEHVSLLSLSLSACSARIDKMALSITELAQFCQGLADARHAAVASVDMCDERVQQLLHDLREQCLADVHRRLDAADSRSEEFLHDLRDLRTMLNTSITKAAEEQRKLDSVFQRLETLREAASVEVRPLEEVDQSKLRESQDQLHAEVKNLVVAVSQRAQEAFELSQNAMDLVNDDAGVVEQLKLRLAEIGQWANDARVAGQRLENDVSAQSGAAAERWRQLEVLESRVQEHIHSSLLKHDAIDALVKRVDYLHSSSVKHDAVDALAKRIHVIQCSSVTQGAIDALAKRVDDIHCSFVKNDAIITLSDRVDQLGGVEQHAKEALKLGLESQEAMAAQQETLAGAVNLIMLSQKGEAVDEVERTARKAHEMGEKLCAELQVQKEAFEAHSTIARERFQFLDDLSARLESFGVIIASESHLRESAMVRIENKCQESTQKIVAAMAEKSSELDSSAHAQHPVMIADVWSDAARAETCRRRDGESAPSSLRSEFDSFHDWQRTAPSSDAHTKVNNDRSLSRWLTSNHPSPVATPTSGLRAPSPGVVRTSSAPVRERPVVAASMPALVPSICVQGAHSLSAVPQWSSTSHSQVTRPMGPRRSARKSSPTRHAMLTTTSAAPRSLSPTRGYVQPEGQVLKASLASNPRAQAVPNVASRVTTITTTPRGAASTVCIVCGNICMDDTPMCRRCTLNSQQVGSNMSSPM